MSFVPTNGRAQVKLTEESRRSFSEVRLSQAEGGPAAMEVVFKATEHGTQMSVWNPLRQEWAVLELHAPQAHQQDKPDCMAPAEENIPEMRCLHGNPLLQEPRCEGCIEEDVLDGVPLYVAEGKEFPDHFTVTPNDNLFNEIGTLANHVRTLRSIVQNEMTLTREEFEEWNREAVNLQAGIERWRQNVISHVTEGVG